jgi:hypothetical protein
VPAHIRLTGATMVVRFVLLSVAAIVLYGCDNSARTYTLYRSSVTSETLRMHVASFDTADGEDYNRENCFLTRDLYAAQPGVIVRYWCELGRFRS